jgi:YggT family protein
VDILLEVARGTLALIISVLQIAMCVRAVMSWFPMDENKFLDFLYAITEPLILPVRMLFDKMNVAVGFPIDIPFFVTFLLLSLLGMVV